MTRYGVHIRNPADGDFVCFTITHPLQPGRYHLGREQGATVYLAEDIASLMLMVGPIIAQAEEQAQGSFEVSHLPTGAGRKAADDLTAGLNRSINETSDVWVKDPPWIHSLRWAGPSRG